MSCGRGIFIGMYAAIIFGTAIYCLIKLYKHMGRISYEMIPLSTCAMQSLLHFINVIFLITNSLQIVIIYFCLQTFILIAQSFIHLYYKLTASTSDFKKYQQFQKYSMITFYVIFTSIMITFLLLISNNCSAYFTTGIVLQFLIIFVSVTICWIYGNKLKQLISNRESTKEIVTATQQTTTIQYVLSISAVLIFVMSILAVTEFRGLLCNLPQPNFDYGFTAGENVYLTFFSMLEMTPCILVPVIFFYLPQISSQDDNQNEFLLNEQKTVSYRQSLDFSGLISKSIELHQ